jgi:hypothetical protein
VGVVPLRGAFGKNRQIREKSGSDKDLQFRPTFGTRCGFWPRQNSHPEKAEKTPCRDFEAWYFSRRQGLQQERIERRKEDRNRGAVLRL